MGLFWLIVKGMVHPCREEIAEGARDSWSLGIQSRDQKPVSAHAQTFSSFSFKTGTLCNMLPTCRVCLPISILTQSGIPPDICPEAYLQGHPRP